VLQIAGVHHVIGQEHQPGDDADHHADPAAGPGNDHQRQDGRHDDRQVHHGVEALEESGIALRAGLARLLSCFRSGIHRPDRARPAGPGT
jgi:hypothetical protein